MDLKSLLNENQYQAVSTSAQYARVVAGAGSGKTRVLTFRIVYLLSEMHVDPYRVVAFTFTNKVAGEMKDRVLKLVPEVGDRLKISTFHSFCSRFLRSEISAIDFPTNFTIFDDEDQEKLIKDIAVGLGYKKKDDIVKMAISYIGNKKCAGYYPEDITIANNTFPSEKECLKIFTLYEERKNSMFALDFDDLLLKTINILTDFRDIREKWQRRIDHILIDEFQDTNDVQYKLISLLLKPTTTLFVVGDPDQTIYTWRGANQHIILNMEKKFHGLETYVLDRNYRSTQKILDTANSLISHNKMRVKKDLYTKNISNYDVVVKGSSSPKEEANWVTREIEKLVKTEGYSYKDIALLYRSNYITIDFEHSLTMSGIPYRIFGGLRFYQRREIKDVIAYFRLIVNKNDDMAFERIINAPRRGVGDTSLLTLKTNAHNQKKSLYVYVEDVDPFEADVKKSIIFSLKDMIALLDKARESINENIEAFSETLKKLIVDLGYFDYLSKEEDGEDRLDNIKTLLGDVTNFLKTNPEATFDEYLQNIALLSSQDDINDGNYVSLMTAHTAKGLEYPVVFVVRLNEGVFPNQRAVLDSGYIGLEEERRLCYVAFTRAKERLILTYNNGYSFIVGSSLIKSRFFEEANLYVSPVTGVRRQTEWTFTSDDNPPMFDEKPKTKPVEYHKYEPRTNGIDDWLVGDKLTHTKLGDGVVTKVEGDGIIEVDFVNHGKKLLIGSHPALSRITKGHEA